MLYSMPSDMNSRLLNLELDHHPKPKWMMKAYHLES
jgi:hypothetical protein